VQLLLYTDYALRVLIYVGTHPDAPVASPTIAAAYGISVDHVAKAAKALTRHGLLRATRGARGGVELAKPAHVIRLGDVVRLFERDRGPVECLRGGGAPCRIEPACRLRGAFQRAEAAFYRELDAHSLEDVVEDRPKLLRLLGLGAVRPRARA
jgi:Rrf2 family nitric oxide-sensitive transcriptional repressor